MLFYQPFFSPFIAWTIVVVPIAIALFMRRRGPGARWLLALSGIALVVCVEAAKLLSAPLYLVPIVVALILPLIALRAVTRNPQGSK